MKPRFLYGLIAGAIGLVLNICISAAIGLCGPFVALLAGAGAGFFAAQAEKVPTKNEGAQLGATAGAIAGGLTLVGQLVGSISILLFVMMADIEPIIGSIPDSSDMAGQSVYLLSGLGIGVCFGLVGIILGVLAGAGAGYLGTPEIPAAQPEN